MEEPKSLKYNHYTDSQLREEYLRQMRFGNLEEANLIVDQAIWTGIRPSYLKNMVYNS